MVSKILKVLFFNLFLFSTVVQLRAQDPVFSQFYSSPVQINPAFAGNTLNPFISLQYRNQWPALKAYVTYAATYDQAIPDLNIGTGILLMTDNAGDGIYKTNQVAGFFSYDLQLGNDIHTKIGVEAGYVQSRLNWNKLVFFDQLDPRYGTKDAAGNPNLSGEQRPDNLNQGILDLGAGILAYNHTYYAGMSYKHLTSPDVSYFNKNNKLFVGLPTRITVHAGAQYALGSSYSPSGVFISPNIMYVKQGEFSQINGGAYIGINKFFFGGWYRHSGQNADAIIDLVGFQQDILKIGYSYDFTLSGLSGNSGGSHEVSLTFNFDNTERAKKRQRYRDMQDCFKMFR